MCLQILLIGTCQLATIHYVTCLLRLGFGLRFCHTCWPV